ncbi:unnamed protein product [Ceutorhynchus assimilis]|uniref:DUF7869 domain-containing protein n=1 Tax=Ceutorhynchus assimilis TaxID=467358 RepID=A0A9N9MHT3_9CUCU|nr:unnamed protein product [Ceutorhynchus assimilis]
MNKKLVGCSGSSRSWRILQLALSTNENVEIKDFNISDDDDSVKDLTYIPTETDLESDSDEELQHDERFNAPNVSLKPSLQPFQDKNDESDDNLPLSVIKEKDIIRTILTEVVEKVVGVERQLNFTKKGAVRKRKRYDIPLKDRKKMKLIKIVDKHDLKENCNENCKKLCQKNINRDRQKYINTEYWKLNKQEQKSFIFSKVEKTACKRRTTTPNVGTAEGSRRNFTLKYFLADQEGKNHAVCKKFFLATVGYDLKNDKLLRHICEDTSSLKPKIDNRGQFKRANKVNTDIIRDHIQTFNPSIHHYRREHAPLRLYLPTDINIKMMYDDFKLKHGMNISYELYRKEVAAMNISFTKLGHEECFACETFSLHSKATGHTKETAEDTCQECTTWKEPQQKYREARKEYAKDGAKEDELCFSADLQKVIMLPRCDMFKEVIFIPRIIVFNETFVPVGKKTSGPENYPYAFVWHEAISGRSKDDLVSIFYNFLLCLRDAKHITVWLDNCAAQNKNWSLFSFFVYIINSSLLNLQTLDIKYFQSGHTFMSSDSFHHQIELSLKKRKKVYDFQDFLDCVKSSNSKKVNLKEVKLDGFYTFTDYTSQQTLKKIVPRPYLSDMVFVRFNKGEKHLQYKTSFHGDFIDLKFLMAKYYKCSTLPGPAVKEKERGITSERKNNIINKLADIIPENRMAFWRNLAETNDETD